MKDEGRTQNVEKVFIVITRLLETWTWGRKFDDDPKIVFRLSFIAYFILAIVCTDIWSRFVFLFATIICAIFSVLYYAIREGIILLNKEDNDEISNDLDNNEDS